MTNHTSPDLVGVISAFIQSCCYIVIIPMCKDNITQLRERVKTEHTLRNPDLSDKEVFTWMKKLSNLKKRSDFLLQKNENRASFCSFLLTAFDNFEAATYLQQWEKLIEEEPVPAGPKTPESTSTPLTHKSTAPVGAMDAQLTVYQEMESVNRGRKEGDRNYLARRDPWVLDSLGFLEGNGVVRGLISTPRKPIGDDGTAIVQSRHGTRLIRSKSFEIIHEERMLIFDKRFLVNYFEH